MHEGLYRAYANIKSFSTSDLGIQDFGSLVGNQRVPENQYLTLLMLWASHSTHSFSINCAVRIRLSIILVHANFFYTVKYFFNHKTFFHIVDYSGIAKEVRCRHGGNQGVLVSGPWVPKPWCGDLRFHHYLRLKWASSDSPGPYPSPLNSWAETQILYFSIPTPVPGKGNTFWQATDLLYPYPTATDAPSLAEHLFW